MFPQNRGSPAVPEGVAGAVARLSMAGQSNATTKCLVERLPCFACGIPGGRLPFAARPKRLENPQNAEVSRLFYPRGGFEQPSSRRRGEENASSVQAAWSCWINFPSSVRSLCVNFSSLTRSFGCNFSSTARSYRLICCIYTYEEGTGYGAYTSRLCSTRAGGEGI